MGMHLHKELINIKIALPINGTRRSVFPSVYITCILRRRIRATLREKKKEFQGKGRKKH